MKNEPHQSHELEWSNSSHYEYVCKICNVADTTSGWGELVYPCGYNREIVGSNPLPEDVQSKVSELVNYIDQEYDLDQGSTALFWGLSYYIGERMKPNES